MTKDKRVSVLLIITFAMWVLFSGCSSSKLDSVNNAGSSSSGSQSTQKDNDINPAANQAAQGTADTKQNVGGTQGTASEGSDKTAPVVDLAQVKPNEAGKIMIVMFHNFVESYKSGDKYYTTTFDDFRKLLNTLYTSGYRLINLNDFLNNRIDVPAGCIPMVFTFDDGTAGQFNLVDNNGRLEANKLSAVGIMEEFSKLHPDFGLKGTFYVNLGCQVFPGKGTVEERLAYLTGKGFEIGNHTLSHINLKNVKTAEEVQREIGGNQKKMLELLPGYLFTTMSLPYGSPSKELQHYVAKGEYEGLKYENKGIMEVGWDPSQPPASRKFNPLSIHRVRASGIVPVEADLAWWLKELSRKEQYISDGNVNTVTVPKGRESLLDPAKLRDYEMIVY